ncbi:hypothetical protein [Streptomyces wedmorensis]
MWRAGHPHERERSHARPSAGPGSGLAGFRTSARRAEQAKETLTTRLGATGKERPQPPGAQRLHHAAVAPVAPMAPATWRRYGTSYGPPDRLGAVVLSGPPARDDAQSS